MRITFLDASTLHRGDLDFSPIEKHGSLAFHDNTLPGQLPAHAEGAEVVVTNKVPFRREDFERLPDLKLILIAATGYNHIDLQAAAERGIPVCNVAGYSTEAVAQHVFALLLNLATNAHRYAANIDTWPDSPIFTHLDHPITELAGKQLGIVGLGDIGGAVARIGSAFGMTVKALAREGSPSAGNRLPRDEFFSTCDVITLHCPLTPATEKMINSESLALMKPSAFLINTGRGGLIDEAALAETIRRNGLAGVGLDVLSVEPPKPGNPLLAPDLREKNLLITPHTAWSALESRQRLLGGLFSNLEAWIAGSPTNKLN